MPRTEVSGSQIKDGSVALSGAASPTGNADVAGVLPAGNGGTGLSSPGASGNVLTSDGTGWTTAAPTGGSASGVTTATVDTLAQRDSAGNLYADNFISSVQSTVTGSGTGTTTLLQASTQVQVFTGTNTHTVLLPTNSVLAGQVYTIINNSTNTVTVNSSSGGQVWPMPTLYNGTFTALVNTPTLPAHWRAILVNATGLAATSSNSLAAFATSTTNTIGVGTIELGHASDTTLSRSAAGTLAVEGVPVVTTTASQTLTNKIITEATTAVGTIGATVTLSLTGTIQTATLTSNTPCTVTMPAVSNGASFVLYLRQPATGTPTTATFTNVRWGTAGAPTITAVLGRMDILTFFSDGTNWYGQYAQGFQY